MATCEPKLDVFADGFAERWISGEAGGVEGGHVQLDEAGALGLGDSQAAVDGDQVGEAELAGEALGAAEGLGGEGGDVVDMLGLSATEEWLQERIGQDAVVESGLESMQGFFATGEFKE
jgi:hypothetical protein